MLNSSKKVFGSIAVLHTFSKFQSVHRLFFVRLGPLSILFFSPPPTKFFAAFFLFSSTLATNPATIPLLFSTA